MPDFGTTLAAKVDRIATPIVDNIYATESKLEAWDQRHATGPAAGYSCPASACLETI